MAPRPYGTRSREDAPSRLRPLDAPSPRTNAPSSAEGRRVGRLARQGATGTEVQSSIDTSIDDMLDTLVITETQIGDDSISTPKLQANSVIASKIFVAQLSAIAADIGDITAGKLRNAGNTLGILLSGALPGTWTRYINFLAAGAAPFLKHDALSLNADGSADFSGNVSSSSFSAADAVFSDFLTLGHVGVPGSGSIVWRGLASAIKAQITQHAAGGIIDGVDVTVGELFVAGTRAAKVISAGLAPSGVAPEGTLWLRYGGTKELHVYTGGAWQQVVP